MSSIPEQGYVILAVDTSATNYVKCASVLADSLHDAMPGAHVTLITDVQPSDSIKRHFDGVTLLPHGDIAADKNWRLANDWQVYEASPYEYTIKLEADMYVPRSIEHWWTRLRQHDLVLCNTIRDTYNRVSTSTAYRRVLVDNKLPIIYNAVTYFRRSELAEEFYGIVKDIFNNWVDYRTMLRGNVETEVTTDTAYSLAAHIIGVERCTLPEFQQFSMIHMKPRINGGVQEDWTNEFLCELTEDTVRINTSPQLYPLHYHVKHFAQTLAEWRETR